MTRDRIVELAAAHAPADERLAGSAYSSVVAVDPQIMQERGGAASLVHGITNEEIACGPSFAEAWGRFLQWARALLDNAVREDLADTDDEQPCAPQPEEAPILLLAGHNGARASVSATAAGQKWALYTNISKLTTQVRFDFALLLCEVIRHGLPCQPFENWRYVDTMVVLQTTSHHGCAKLQCASHRIMAETGRAHRAPLGGCQGMSPAVSWRIVIPRGAVDPPRLSTIA